MKRFYLSFHDIIALALIVGFGSMASLLVGIFLLSKKEDSD